MKKKQNKNLLFPVSNNSIQDCVSELVLSELAELIPSKRYKYLVSALIDQKNKQVICISADLVIHLIPFEWLSSNTKSTNNFKLSFDKIGLADYGQTLVLGTYEIDVSWMLETFRKDELSASVI